MARLVTAQGNSIWVDVTEYCFNGEVAEIRGLGARRPFTVDATAARARIATVALEIAVKRGEVSAEVAGDWILRLSLAIVRQAA